MRRRGFIHLVGVGPSDEDSMSLGALRAIESAEEIWMADLGPPQRERVFLRKWLNSNKKVVNLHRYCFVPSCPRLMTYIVQVQRMLYLAARGRRITFLESGNPLVWVHNTTLLKRWAGAIDFRITPSMSFL